MISLTPKPNPKNFQNIFSLSSPDFSPFEYAVWGILENKTNATPHPNNGSLKTTI